jgi:hypothetical protein
MDAEMSICPHKMGKYGHNKNGAKHGVSMQIYLALLVRRKCLHMTDG